METNKYRIYASSSYLSGKCANHTVILKLACLEQSVKDIIALLEKNDHTNT